MTDRSTPRGDDLIPADPAGAGAAVSRDEPSEDSLRAVYQEICQGHGAIADFRAKLLALLPAASGTAVFLLLDRSDKAGARGDEPPLLGIGLFGFVVTLGLFMYELRGIQDCGVLRDRAEKLEARLRIPADGSHFHRPHGQVLGWADEVGAGWIIYPAVMISWLYVASVGANIHWKVLPWLLVGLYLAVLSFLSPRGLLLRHRSS